MKRYKYALQDILIIYPSDASISGDTQASQRNLLDVLESGYEIYASNAFSTHSATGIQYILRKDLEAWKDD